MKTQKDEARDAFARVWHLPRISAVEELVDQLTLLCPGYSIKPSIRKPYVTLIPPPAWEPTPKQKRSFQALQEKARSIGHVLAPRVGAAQFARKIRAGRHLDFVRLALKYFPGSLLLGHIQGDFDEEEFLRGFGSRPGSSFFAPPVEISSRTVSA